MEMFFVEDTNKEPSLLKLLNCSSHSENKWFF